VVCVVALHHLPQPGTQAGAQEGTQGPCVLPLRWEVCQRNYATAPL